MFTKKSLIMALLRFVIAAAPVFSAPLSGKITDSQTGQSLPGVYIKIAGTKFAAVSDTNGRFSFGDIPGDEARIIASATGYDVTVKNIRAAQFGTADLALTPRVLRGQDIIVTASRAIKGQTPAAFSNMTNHDIAENYWAQDIPVMLSVLPNVYAYSDAGSGIGYSYMKMRGFDQKRIAVMLNGIPLNDAESHEVFWVDLPDFAASADDIQVQRGVGSSLYGASALGGSVNLVTSNFTPLPKISVESGYGSYNTRKFSLAGNSGLINDNYIFYGRYSRLQTDGYRQSSWTKAYSYFVGLSGFNENMNWKFNAYGGPEESHLAYKGITNEQLDTNRRYNVLQYAGEIDHFSQPHYEFLHTWKLSDVLDLANTFYYFSGDGYYTQKRNRKDIEEFFPGFSGITVSDTALAPRDYYDLTDSGAFALNSDSLYTIKKADIIKRPTVNENDWGWIPNITYAHGSSAFKLGGELRIHSAHHYGEVIWSNTYPGGLAPDTRYYDYRGKSRTATIYALETIRLGNRLEVMANIQYQAHAYNLSSDKRFNVGFKKSYDYLSPRVGANYHFDRNTDFFVNVSTSSRHPAFKDIYDPTDYWSNPGYKPDNFRASGADWKYIGKELKPERLVDFELGGNFNIDLKSITLKSSLNLYRMQITDEILPYAGQIDDMGYPISGNARETMHQGIEYSLESKLPANIVVSGNISFNDDHFVKYKEYGFDYDNWVAIEYDRSQKKIGGFPVAIANYRVNWAEGNLEISLLGNFIGRQYIDNGETFRLNSYYLSGAVVSYDFGKIIGLKSLQASLRINNLGDRKYVAAAYIEPDDDMPRYIVGAERNLYLSLRASL